MCGKLNEWQPVTHGSVFANVLSMELPHYREATCLYLASSFTLALSWLGVFSSYFVAHFYALLLLHRIMKWILHDIDSPAGPSSFLSLFLCLLGCVFNYLEFGRSVGVASLMGALDKQEATGSLIRRKYLWRKVSWNAAAIFAVNFPLSFTLSLSLFLSFFSALY